MGVSRPTPERLPEETRVLLLAPTERDAEASRAVLGAAGISCTRCDNLGLLCREIAAGAGVVIVPEEIVLADTQETLAEAIGNQELWSDLPVIVLSRAGMESVAIQRAMVTIPNISVIERPVRISTLVSHVRSALLAREKQYQVRDLLAARERTERELRDTKEAAVGANKAKDQFLAALSHELRTPLSPVIMTIEELERDASLPDAVRERLRMVRRNVELETRLIDDLLDVSRAASGKLRLRLETVSLHHLLGQVVDVCASEQLAKRIKVVTRFSAEVDAVRVDAARMQQVFWNLLKNAIKFSPDGEEISVCTEDASGGRVRVRVQDHGMGIPAEVLPRLFAAFEQGVPGTTHRFGGLGLGLAISKAVVQLHDGVIWAESGGTGHGATFLVELPVTEPPRAQTTEAPTFVAETPPRYLRILLAEDHADSAAVLSRILVAWGHQVRVARTVEGALRLAGEAPFDLLMSDIGLPDATGYDLMRQVRERFEIPGIALSGYALDEDVARSRAAGFSDHLAKPVNLATLEAAIRRLTRDSSSG